MWQLFADAAWKVLLAGLVLGAGLPAVFALGVRFSAVGAGQAHAGAADSHGGSGGGRSAGAGRPGFWALGIVCFALVAIAVALGITVIVAAGFGQVVSFGHVFPTLVPKS